MQAAFGLLKALVAFGNRRYGIREKCAKRRHELLSTSCGWAAYPAPRRSAWYVLGGWKGLWGFAFGDNALGFVFVVHRATEE